MRFLQKYFFRPQEWRQLLSLASNSAILTGANVINALTMLFTIPLIIHHVSMAGYGVLVLIQAFSLIVTRFFDGQSWQVYIRAIGLGYDKLAALKVGLYLDGLFFLGLLLSIASVSHFVQSWQNQVIPFDICALFVLSILNQSAFTWIGALRLEGKFFTLAMTTALPSIFRLLVLLLLSIIMSELSLRSIAWVFALTELIRFFYTAICGWQLLRKHSIDSRKKTNSAWKAVQHFTFWNWLMSLVDLPIQYLDSLLVGRFLSLELLGVYGTIKRIANVFSQLTSPLYQVIFPEFTRLLGTKSFKACYQLLWRSVWIMSGFGVVGMIVLFLTRTFWMPWFELSLSYGVELFLLMSVQTVAIAFTAVHPLLNALGWVRQGFYIVLGSNIIYLLLLWMLGLPYGIFGVIISIAIQCILVVGGKWYLIARYANTKVSGL